MNAPIDPTQPIHIRDYTGGGVVGGADIPLTLLRESQLRVLDVICEGVMGPDLGNWTCETMSGLYYHGGTE